MLRSFRVTHICISLVLLASLLALGRPYFAVAGSTAPRSTETPAPELTATPTQAPTAPAPDPSSPFGIAGVMRWPDWGTFSQPADTFLQTGASWVREDFAWGLIEPQENSFSWTATDRIVSTLNARKVNVLGIISYSANWATATKDDDKAGSATSFYPPDDARYTAFIHALISRYKGSVHYWEIWNEPNNPMFWKPAPDPKAYADLLKTAYRAVKDVDPTAQVLTAGMSGNAVPFLESMISAGAGDSFDILALHPYAVPLDPSQGLQQSQPEVHKIVDVELAKYQALLDRHNYKRPIWVTELGWPAGDWGLDPNMQANYLVQSYAQMLGSGLTSRIFWYSFKDGSSNAGDSWGLLGWGGGSTDLSQKRPAFNAYSTMSHLLAGTTPAGTLQLAPYIVIADFEQSSTWTRSMNNVGAMSSSNDVAHSGKSAGKLQYNFASPNQAVDFAPATPINLPGKPTRIGLWVLGDGSGDYLSAWLKDRDGELFEVRLGAVMGASSGWHYYEASTNGYYFDWEHTGGSPANAVPDSPLQFVGFRLENTPDEPAGSGTIYVDDLQSYGGPDASAVRFSRSDGQVVDVLWSTTSTSVSLATRSTAAQEYSRDGAPAPVQAKNGTLTLNVSSSPIYIVHKPGDNPLTTPSQQTPPVTGSSGGGSQQAVVVQQTGDVAVCAAANKVQAAPNSDSIYFSQTGHSVGGVFRQYWDTHGGLQILGYPITEEFTAQSSDGKQYRQQYFERARLEYHPQYAAPYNVLVGLLGTWITDGRTFSNMPAAPTGAIFYPQTGHGVLLFKDWWNAHGGLAVFGYPISGELQERNSTDGKTYTVQYFERNRLEYHPEYAGTDQAVLLGLLGVEYLAKQGCH